MSSTDGIGGPKGPTGPGRIDPTDVTERSGASERRFSLEAPESAQAAEAPSPLADPTVAKAIEHAAGELRAGRLADVRAALDVVVSEIVETRYPHMAAPQRQQFARHLQEILADDPGLGAHLAAELERAARE
jgi:hypothetical protein